MMDGGKTRRTYCSILERARMEASWDLEVKATMEMPASMWTAREKSWCLGGVAGFSRMFGWKSF